MWTRLTGEEDEALRAGNVVPWEAVTRLEDGLVTVRDELARAPAA
jgi:hypothetical protein